MDQKQNADDVDSILDSVLVEMLIAETEELPLALVA
jgi:hypothetical protein